MRPGRWPKTFADDHAPGRPAAQRLGDERCVGAEEGHRRHQATSSSANPSPSTSAGRSDALAALGSPGLRRCRGSRYTRQNEFDDILTPCRR